MILVQTSRNIKGKPTLRYDETFIVAEIVGARMNLLFPQASGTDDAGLPVGN